MAFPVMSELPKRISTDSIEFNARVYITTINIDMNQNILDFNAVPC